ncbi:MAG TPA: hypothetical protein VI753_14780 [Anaerolineales bacterium]|nr:hypothetical protein [Anaerolineales bacterium]
MPESDFPVSIRFAGPQFKTKGVSIQDLGETFIAMQRMVYKAYFVQQKHSFRKAVPSIAERKLLALGIGDHKRGSDIYQFIWQAMQGAQAIPIDMKELTTQIAASMVLIGGGKIWNIVTKPKKESVDLLAIALYNELEELADRIGKAGGITKIEIHLEGRRAPIVINAKLRNEIKNTRKNAKLSRKQALEGDVIAPHTIGEDYAIVRVGTERIKVHFKSKGLFREMMRELGPRPTARFRFTGRPRLMIDFDPERFVEFFAETVKAIKDLTTE